MSSASRPSTTAEHNYRELAEFVLREYLNQLDAAQSRAAEFAHTPTFRLSGATALYNGIAHFMAEEFGAEPPAPKVERLRERVASTLESEYEATPESWLKLL